MSLFQVTADLSGSFTTDEGVFVIGNVPEANLKISDDTVKTKLKYAPSNDVQFNQFVDETDLRAYNILLLYGNVPEIHIFGYRPFIELRGNVRIASLMKESFADMLVVGQEPPLLSVEPFNNFLFPQWKFWWHRNIQFKPLSINACDSPTGITVDDQGANPSERHYQLGAISPGCRCNHCSGDVKFDIEDLFKFEMPVGSKSDDIHPARVQPLPPDTPTDPSNVQPVVPNTQASPEIPESEETISVSDIDDQMDHMDDNMDHIDDNMDHLDDNMDHLDNDMDGTVNSEHGLDQSEALDVEKANAFLWKTTRYFFAEEWGKFWREFQNDIVPWKYIERHRKTQFWIEPVKNEKDPSKSALGCWKCRLFAELLMLAKSRITALGSSKGSLRDTKIQNIKSLRNHEGDPIHMKIDQTMELYQVETREQFFEILKNIRAELIKATADQFESIFYEALTGQPYEDHELLTNLQIRHGASLGEHLQSRYAATTMTDYIADKAFIKMVNWLISSQSPCTLLIDESVDSKHKNLLVIMIQVVRNNYPVVWTYKTIEITEGTGEGIYKSIVAEFERDGTVEYFKKNMFSFACDGASKNLGLVRGAATYFNRFSDHDLIITHCMAHKCNLAGKWGFKEHPYMKDLEQLVNQIYRFYRNKSHVRKDHIFATSVELGMYLYELTQVHQIRWISSELWAFEVIKRNYKILVTDLLKIIDDHKTFGVEAREKAAIFHNALTSRRFVVMLHFTLDVLKYLSVWSKQLQKHNGLLFDKKRFRDKTLQNLMGIVYDGGDNFSKLLNEVECWGEVEFFLYPGSYIKEESEKMKCSEHEIYAAEHVKWMGIDLLPADAEQEGSVGYFPKVGDIRAESLGILREKILEYFPDDKLLDAFSYLDPSRFPNPNTDIFLQVYYHISKSSIAAIAIRFQITDETFLEELDEQWRRFVLHFTSVPEDIYKEHVKLESPDFWKLYLDKKDPDFVIEPNLRKVLENCISLAMGTSSVERTFSVLGALHTKERNRLTLKHRNSMLYIRTNMQMDLESFPGEEMAEMWYEDGHYRADDPIVPVRKKPPNESKPGNIVQKELEKKNAKEKYKLFSKTP